MRCQTFAIQDQANLLNRLERIRREKNALDTIERLFLEDGYPRHELIYYSLRLHELLPYENHPAIIAERNPQRFGRLIDVLLSSDDPHYARAAASLARLVSQHDHDEYRRLWKKIAIHPLFRVREEAKTQLYCRTRENPFEISEVVEDIRNLTHAYDVSAYTVVIAEILASSTPESHPRSAEDLQFLLEAFRATILENARVTDSNQGDQSRVFTSPDTFLGSRYDLIVTVITGLSILRNHNIDEVLEIFEQLVESPDRLIRQGIAAGVKRLVQSPTPRIIALLERNLSDECRDVTELAAEALEVLAESSYSDFERLVARQIKATTRENRYDTLSHQSRKHLSATAHHIAKNNPELYTVVLRRAAGSLDEVFRHAAAVAFGSLARHHPETALALVKNPPFAIDESYKTAWAQFEDFLGRFDEDQLDKHAKNKAIFFFRSLAKQSPDCAFDFFTSIREVNSAQTLNPMLVALEDHGKKLESQISADEVDEKREVLDIACASALSAANDDLFSAAWGIVRTTHSAFAAYSAIRQLNDTPKAYFVATLRDKNLARLVDLATHYSCWPMIEVLATFISKIRETDISVLEALLTQRFSGGPADSLTDRMTQRAIAISSLPVLDALFRQPTLFMKVYSIVDSALFDMQLKPRSHLQPEPDGISWAPVGILDHLVDEDEKILVRLSVRDQGLFWKVANQRMKGLEERVLTRGSCDHRGERGDRILGGFYRDELKHMHQLSPRRFYSFVAQMRPSCVERYAPFIVERMLEDEPERIPAFLRELEGGHAPGTAFDNLEGTGSSVFGQLKTCSLTQMYDHFPEIVTAVVAGDPVSCSPDAVALLITKDPSLFDLYVRSIERMDGSEYYRFFRRIKDVDFLSRICRAVDWSKSSRELRRNVARSLPRIAPHNLELFLALRKKLTAPHEKVIAAVSLLLTLDNAILEPIRDEQFEFLEEVLERPFLFDPDDTDSVFVALRRLVNREELDYGRMLGILRAGETTSLDELVDCSLFSARESFLKRLGSGAAGSTYLVEAPQFQNRRMALKVLKQAPEKESESGILSTLFHRNIVRVYYAGLNLVKHMGKEQYAILMDYVEGKDLSEVLRPRVDPKIALDLGEQLLEAIRFLRSKNVFHRDLSGRNIRVTPEGQLKIVDFGLAVGELERQNPYNRRYGGPTDVFSWGLLFFEMCTGRHLVEEHVANEGPRDYVRHLHAAQHEIRTKEGQLHPQTKKDLSLLPDQLRTIVQKALEFEGGDSPIDDLLAGLHEVRLGESEIEARIGELAELLGISVSRDQYHRIRGLLK